VYALKGSSGTDLVSFLRAQIMRLWRRCHGFARRFPLSRVHVPYHAGSVAVVVFFIAAAIFGMFAGGHASRAFNMVASASGFAVTKIHVSGNRQISDIDVLDALALDPNISMIGFDVAGARAAIAAFPWVASVSVQKIYPDQINIAIVERQPAAAWQHDNRVDIIDGQGRVIVAYSAALGHGLPLMVGHGAERYAAAFLDDMKPFKTIRERARAYIRIGDRRWDVLLDNGVRIKLPETGAPQRLAQVMALDSSSGLLSRDVETIDLRLDDRITVALSDEALARRQAAVKDLERREQAQKAGRV